MHDDPSPSRLARLRDPIEAGFGRFGRVVYRHAWVTIALVMCFVGGLATQLPKLEIDTSTEGMFPESDPIRATYSGFRDLYGRDQAILVAIEGETLYDLEFLERLRALHDELESELPHLQDVTSLVNVRHTRGEADELVVDDLLAEWPRTEADLATLRERIETTPLYEDQLVSQDGRIANIVVKPNVYSSIGQDLDVMGGFDEEGDAGETDEPPPFLTGQENTEITLAVEAIVARHEAPGFEPYLAGMPIMVDRLMRVMAEDMGRFTGLALAVIALLLGLVFRRPAGVALPLVVSGLAMLSTMSVMAIIGIPLTTTTQITPSFLLAVGVGSAVHILSIYYQAIARHEPKEEAIAFALEHSGLAVVMTSLTTAGGILSFVSADLLPLVEMGIVTSIGIVMALGFSLLLLPALIAVIPLRASHGTDPARSSPTREVLMRCGDFAVTHAGPVVAVCALIIAVSIAGALRLEVSHDPIGWFPPDAPIRISMDKIDAALNGSMFVEAVIDTGRENGVRDPDLLMRIDRAVERIYDLRVSTIYVGKATSLNDVVKETHRALNENRASHYAIPERADLLSQELLLFENSGADDLDDLVDFQFSQTRLSLKMPFTDGIEYAGFFAEVRRVLEEELDGRATVTLTGESMIMVHTVELMIYNMMKTYAIAFTIITPLMMMLLGSLRFGLVSMIPNLAPIAITLGIMGWFGMPLDVFTLLIGSIALGLAVDDTVHFMHNFRRYYERGDDVRHAVRETLSTTGQALLFTSITLASGFFIYTFATMSNLFYFGLLTAITILLAFLADLILAPALMSLLAHRITAQRSPRVSSEA